MQDPLWPRYCANPDPGAASAQGVSNVPEVIVWLPLASIARTSKSCEPRRRLSTNSFGSVTCVAVAGRVTWNGSTITWYPTMLILLLGNPGGGPVTGRQRI